MEVALLKVPAHVLHAVVPAQMARELMPAEAAAAVFRRRALLLPASVADALEGLFERLALFAGDRLLAVAGDPGAVHAALVLGEEILAVEIVKQAGFVVGCAARGR